MSKGTRAPRRKENDTMKANEFDFSRDSWCDEYERVCDGIQYEDDDGNLMPICTDTMDACYKFLADRCGVDLDKRFDLHADYEIGSYVIVGGYGQCFELGGPTVREFIRDLIYSDFCGLVTMWTPNPVHISVGDHITMTVYKRMKID